MGLLTTDQLGDLKSVYNTEEYHKYDDVTYSPVRGVLAKDGYKTMDDVLLFQFNPSVINDAKDVEWSTRGGVGFSSNNYLWVKGGERQLTFKLWFDATAESNSPTFRPEAIYGDATYDNLNKVFPRGVMPMVEKLTSFQYPQIIDGNAPRYAGAVKVPEVRFMPPPLAIFIFGEFYMKGIISAVNTSYPLFDRKLKPLRAECDVTFKVIETDILVIDQYLLNKSKQIEEYTVGATAKTGKVPVGPPDTSLGNLQRR